MNKLQKLLTKCLISLKVCEVHSDSCDRPCSIDSNELNSLAEELESHLFNEVQE